MRRYTPDSLLSRRGHSMIAKYENSGFNGPIHDILDDSGAHQVNISR